MARRFQHTTHNHWDQVSSERCSYCKQPMTMAEHSGFTKCFTPSCRGRNHVAYVIDGGVNALPFGADTVYHTAFSQRQPDFTATMSIDPYTNMQTLSIEKGDAAIKPVFSVTKIGSVILSQNAQATGGIGDDYGNTETTQAKSATIMMHNDPHYALVEIVFGYIRNVGKNGRSTRPTTQTNRNEMVFSDGRIYDALNWNPPKTLLKYLAFQLCSITCRAQMTLDEFDASHACYGYGQVVNMDVMEPTSSLSSTSSLSTTCSGASSESFKRFSHKEHCDCCWFKQPINISELKILISKCGHGDKNSDWTRIAKNSRFLVKIFSALYGYKPIKLSTQQLSEATSWFMEAKGMLRFLSSVRASVNDSKTVEPKLKKDGSPFKGKSARPSKAVFEKFRTMDSPFGSSLVPRTPSTSASSAATSKAAASNVTENLKAGYLWYRIFGGIFTALDPSSPEARILPHFFPLPNDPEKIAKYDGWFDLISNMCGWSKTANTATSLRAAPVTDTFSYLVVNNRHQVKTLPLCHQVRLRTKVSVQLADVPVFEEATKDSVNNGDDAATCAAF